MDTIFSLPLIQKRVLRLWLAFQRRAGEADADDTEMRLKELCTIESWSVDGSDVEEDEEEEMENSEPMDDSDVVLSDSGRLEAADVLVLSGSVSASKIWF